MAKRLIPRNCSCDLIPATGGIFTVHLTYQPDAAAETQRVLLWDRAAEKGFPETKILKQRVRNHIEPGKSLGHSDTPAHAKATGAGSNSGPIDVHGHGLDSAPTRAETSATDAPSQDCAGCK